LFDFIKELCNFGHVSGWRLSLFRAFGIWYPEMSFEQFRWVWSKRSSTYLIHEASYT